MASAALDQFLADLAVPGSATPVKLALNGDQIEIQWNGTALLAQVRAAIGYPTVADALSGLTTGQLEQLAGNIATKTTELAAAYGPVVPEHFAMSVRGEVAALAQPIATSLGDAILTPSESPALDAMSAYRQDAAIPVSFNAMASTDDAIRTALRSEITRQADDQTSRMSELPVDQWIAQRVAYQGDSTFMDSVDTKAKQATIALLRERIGGYHERARSQKAKSAAAEVALRNFTAGNGTVEWPTEEVKFFSGRQSGPGDEVGFRAQHLEGIEFINELMTENGTWQHCVQRIEDFESHVLHVDQIAGGCWEVCPHMPEAPVLPEVRTESRAEFWGYIEQLYTYVGAGAVNSSLGSQWRYRIDDLYAAVITQFPESKSLKREVFKMNVTATIVG